MYRTLPNTELSTRQVLPGALIATALLQLTFESLPLYVRSVEGLPALKVFGGASLLLVWLYIMGNVVLLGGAITWWTSRGRTAAAATAAMAQGPRARACKAPPRGRARRRAAIAPRAGRSGRSGARPQLDAELRVGGRDREHAQRQAPRALAQGRLHAGARGDVHR